MKWTIKSVLLLTVLMISTALSTQAQRGGGWNANPAEQAERQTTMMNDSLTLSSAQLKKVAEINFKYAKLQSEARDEARKNRDPEGDRDAMRKAMRAMMEKIQAERTDELKVILTADQFTKYERIMADRAKKREERRKNRGDRKRKDGDKRKKKDTDSKDRT